jgi:glycosyltransferase involved in cell wall biosynthesis
MKSGRLKVVLPMLTFVPGGMGGSETYAIEVVRALGERDDLDLTVLVAPAAEGLFPAVPEVVVDRVSGGSGTTQRLWSLVQASRGSAAARSALHRADVVHYLFTVPVPPAEGTPRVVTLLDVQHHDVPDMFKRSERLYRRFAYDRSAQHADQIITISAFCKERISECLNIAGDRIEVARLAADRGWFTPAPVGREDFVLYPAAAWPHKNHRRLLTAMETVRLVRPELRLVLTGAGRERLGALPDWAEHLGRISDAQLRDLYRRAACLVFPSMYEGFGLPPLEAMSAGCPVAASYAGSLPEVCADAAAYFDPTDPGDIARGISEALSNEGDLVEQGYRRVATFSWQVCADAHVRAYEAAVGRG